jgi:hypothetical protein
MGGGAVTELGVTEIAVLNLWKTCHRLLFNLPLKIV